LSNLSGASSYPKDCYRRPPRKLSCWVWRDPPLTSRFSGD
jgi:hypothetical protein